MPPKGVESMSIKVYESVTQSIIECLENGVIPWEQDWKSSGGIPKSLNSQKAYRGINSLVLITKQVACGYQSSYWATKKQLESLGATVKPDQEGKYTPVLYFRMLDLKGADESSDRAIPFARFSQNYNLDQVDGLDRIKAMEKYGESKIDFVPLEQCQRIVDLYASKPKVWHGKSASPCYFPLADEIHMPNQEQFQSAEGYYKTLFHELAHSTGHEKRLKRDLKSVIAKTEYSKEELIAEMTAAFLATEAGISKHHAIDRSAAYCQSWLKVLRNDRKMLVQAASAASKAADYIQGIAV